ncbi:internal alternative NAD(P)H-ubiquinone oxidoreductase A1, mitochondrial-like [Heracleum sosnowskyi]|uniref:Internal alternative NAD(P)H-ubiquinone oxidoreductase A1, mitochondrial-like n=1 Tax=Heracleum sosnowskyi TaxID=360622 RepID=A0AAD8JD62_9APIA|nr:internal alternative NAD(P)H-ubiquinone oxidoreductase A1, mitochondrial-like [Heracleum sosnowskyi]
MACPDLLLQASTKEMALARIVRNGLRQSGSVTSHASLNDTTCEGLPTCSNFRPFVVKVEIGINFSYLTSIKKVDQISVGCKGISVTPQYQFAETDKIVEESNLEYENQNYSSLEATKPGEKPWVVVLGTGWVACRFVKGNNTKIYYVVCTSPRNHVVFTPVLASTCVGTLNFWSVAEPITRIQSAVAKNPKSYFYLATCIDVDTNKHEVSSYAQMQTRTNMK